MSKPAWYSPVAAVAGVVAEARAVFNTGALSPLTARKAALQALLDLVKENDAALKEAYAFCFIAFLARPTILALTRVFVFPVACTGRSRTCAKTRSRLISPSWP